MIGKALGVKWKFDEAEPLELRPGDGPSISELAATTPAPVAGGDTLAASRAIIEAMAVSDAP